MQGSTVRAALLTAWLAAAVTPGCSVPGAEGPADTFGIDFAGANAASARGAVVFFVDGLNARIFEEMLQAGELPNFRKHFIDRGLYVPRAVASTPSVTLANETSFVTGLFPGHHGLPGINWFDRDGLRWRNYETIAQKNTLDGDYIAPNLYEQFPGRTTFSLFFQPHRGVTKFVENWLSAGPVFFFRAYEFVDRLTLFRFHIVADVARARGQFPAITIAYQLAPDFQAYAHGVASPQYRQAIRHTDRQVGRVLADIERAGLLKDLYLVLVSDHGHCEVTRHLPMVKLLRDEFALDVATRHLWEETKFEDRLQYYRRYPAVLYGSGDRYQALCLRRPIRRDGKVAGFDSWLVRPTVDDLKSYPTARGPVDLLSALSAQEAVDALAYAAGPDTVRVRTQAGEVEFRQPGGRGAKITCRLLAGADPLGWKGKLPAAALNGEAMTGREWLDATAETDYPDLPAQILAYFRAPRAGDIALFAAPGWDFNDTHRSGHGGLRPCDMLVPLAIAGPGIQPHRLPVARTVDVMPTLVKLLGRPVPPNLDGQPLLDADN